MRRTAANVQRLISRLPSPADADVARLSAHLAGGMSDKGLGKLLRVTPQAVAARRKRVRRLTLLVEAHPELLVAEQMGDQVKAAIARAGWTEKQASYLWTLFWTTTPVVALRMSPIPRPKRLLAEFLARASANKHVDVLVRGLRCVQSLGWGCLWGRAGHRHRKGSRANRIVARAPPDRVDIEGRRRRSRRAPSPVQGRPSR